MQKKVTTDVLWSVAGLVLMNMVAQFVVYPFWNSYLGNETYGNVLYLISLMNVFSISVGTACNNTRMVKSTEDTTHNGDYGVILSVMTVIAVPFGALVYLLNEPDATMVETALFILLTVLTFWRFYSDVRYRLNLDYRGYFCYYMVISLGYVVGILLFRISGYWALALIPGEAAGIILSYFWKSPIRGGLLKPGPQLKTTVNMFLTLLGSNMISHIIFNGDRMLLNLIMGGSTVTIYYLASLLGKTMSLITTPLNGVLIGYLSRFQGEISRKNVNLFTAATLMAIALGTLVAVIGSHILIPILYAENYLQVKEFFVIANLTQVIYFVSNMVTTIMLRIAKTNRQLVVNAVYAVAFLVLCTPAALWYGFAGFCYALLAANIMRYVIAVVCCYVSIRR